jgi:hypothetical protein
MSDKRIQFSNIVRNQLPSYVKEEFPLVSEFLSQYYLSQEFQGAPIDLIQNIDNYIKVDQITSQAESAILLGDISSFDSTIFIGISSTPTGTNGFPEKYGLLKINDEVITYTGITTNSFTGCIRGFSGISSYTSQNHPDQLVFSKTESTEHSSGSTIVNLSSLFLKEFLLKIKHQLTPGFENREFVDGLNDSLFIKQSKDFYRSKGTDQSFELLFKSLYGEDVSIIRPKEYLFRPSDAQFQITNDLVVESIEGNPENLENSTLFQDEVLNFTKAYAPITKVEKIRSKEGKEYYKLSIDASYNRDIRVDGALYGDFKVHSQTKVIGEYNSNSTAIDVDSTVGFSNSGELSVVYDDGSDGIISYTSKNLTQFLGCSNITGIIRDSSSISINVFAYGNSFLNQNEVIRVRITSVLKDIDIISDTFYLKKGYESKIKTLGVNPKDFISNNWLFNIATSYNVESISLIDSSSNTYEINTSTNHIFRIGDNLIIKNSAGVEAPSSTVIDVISEKSFIIRDQGILSTIDNYTIHKNILKTNSTVFPNISVFSANVQNIYKDKDKILVASPSLPYYGTESLEISSKEVIFSETFSSDQFQIVDSGDHGFYTGDVVYYTPEKSGDQIISKLFDEGIYFIKRIDSKTVKFALSRANIYNSKFVSVYVDTPVEVNFNKIEPLNFKDKTLKSQNILREISSPINDGGVYDTEPGFTGILINGVEILNYKSRDVIYSGKLEEVVVIAPGIGYDIINPPVLSITDAVGTGASGYCAVRGSLQEIKIIDPGFDYDEIPTIKITGGNGIGAKAFASMKLIDHQSFFNSEINSAQISLANNTIGFSTYHKFRNAERVIYTTDSQRGVGGLSTDASYHISVQSPTQLKLHKTLNDAVSGINTVQFTSFGIGNHSLKSFNKKSVLGSVNIESSGFGYENKRRTVSSNISGINTSINQINILNHDFISGEIVKYSTSGSVIGGLTSNTEYYVTPVDTNSFKLSEIGTGSTSRDFYYNTRQFINLSSIGVGTHTFNYPEISVEVIGNVGGVIKFKADVQPIFRGEITSVHLESGGVGYGASEILNYNKQPEFRLNSGFGAQVTPIISNGRIVEILINTSGRNYNSIPDLEIVGDGVGAVLTPIIEDGRLIEIKVIESGVGYSPENTAILITPAGSLSEFFVKIQTWNVNLFNKTLSSIASDDGILSEGLNDNYELQYSHLYAPRKLREIVYANDQDGNILYGRKDLRKVSNIEIASTDHSPIIGWAYDGNPIYGPYAYSKRQGVGASIVQMKSGYKEDEIPKLNRPSTIQFPIGFFVEDYTYLDVSDESVLDEYNGRFCVTPEFPNGTYAYFTTINELGTEDFSGYKSPVFPYLIGNKFKSKPNEFNYKKISNQNDTNLNETNWSRNITPYNLTEDNNLYSYVELPNNLDQTIDTKFASPGFVEKIDIVFGGSQYSIGDSLIFDNEGTSGYNASAEVERISGKSVNTISVASTSIFNVEFYPSSNQREFLMFAENPHGLQNIELITVAGFNTSSSLLEGSFIAGISTNTIALTSGIGSTSVTGIVTYFSVAGNLKYPNIRENDVLEIGTERVKVLNVDTKSSRIRVLRGINGTVGSSHSVTDVLYEIPRKLTINSGIRSQYNYKVNRELYFNPTESLGIGTLSGVGIGATIFFSNPGTGITEIFIPTRSIYIPTHQLQTGDELIYSNNGYNSIGVSTNGLTSFNLSNQSIVYVAKITDDLIGISTFRVGLGTEENFVGLTSETNTYGLLYFTNIGSGVYHSFRTTYNTLIGNIFKNTVTVSTAQSHGLLNNDIVFIDVSPSIASTVVLKYNDFNKKILVNSKDFEASDIDIIKNIINIDNHEFEVGQKVIYTSSSPSTGLENNKEYYIIVVDENNIKLTNSYYEALSSKPKIVDINSTSLGTLSKINPQINGYKNSSIVFDVSDSSLGYIQQSSSFSAFDLKFFKDSNFTESYISNEDDPIFEVQRIGSVGITSDAKIILNITEKTPENLYYSLVPVFDGTLPENKRLINIDTEVIANNQINIQFSKYNGEFLIVSTSNTSFTYNIPTIPENNSYNSTTSQINYETNSRNVLDSISKVKILNKGQNYYSLPQVLSLNSFQGNGAIFELSSTSIGKIKKTRINNIGFNFPTDFTLRPSVSIPQVVKVDPLSSLESIEVTSFGRGYTSAPKLIIFDGKTNNILPEVDLKFTLGNNKIEILSNTFALNSTNPTILPIQNSNGVEISNIVFNSTTKDVTITLSVGFSTANAFPFEVDDKILIENIGITSTGKGFNSEDYNYQLFTITSTDPSIGGFGDVTYNLNEFLNEFETPGEFDSDNSSGRIIPQKYFPTFDISLVNNNYLFGETAFSNSAIGTIEDWDPKNNFVSIVSKDNFKVGDLIIGSSSKTQGVASSVSIFDAFLNTGSLSRFENGWKSSAGFLNDNIQRIQDSLYYQNFSYSIKSRVDFDTWNNTVSTLNHTSGFEKFSDYQLESNVGLGSTSVRLTSDTTSIEVISDLIGVINLNCVYDFDLVSENALKIDNRVFSDEINFANRILTDYSKSIGNRVLSIDDISPQFNSNPRSTRFSEVHRFNLADVRSQKYITYVSDRRFLNDRQLLIVTTLIDDVGNTYLNQYARVESNYDMGSFDLAIDDTEGILRFYPTKFAVNDFRITTLSYNINDDLSGIGSTNFGEDIVDIRSSSVAVAVGTTTTIIGIASTYRSMKVLVSISATSINQYEFDELNIIHDGTNVEFLEYGQLTTHSLNSYSSSGLGTYYPYLSGSELKVDFTPNVGIAVTVNVNAVQVAFASTTTVGNVNFLTTTINSPVGIGSTVIFVSDTTGVIAGISSISVVGPGTITNASIVSVASTFVQIGTASTVTNVLGIGTVVIFSTRGVGTYDMKHARLEGRFTTIASTPTPTPIGISSYPDIYDAAYFIVQVSDNTNNIHQLSEVIVVDDSTGEVGIQTNVYVTEYGIINTLSGLGTIGAQRTSSNVELTFTPLPNIDVDVKVYLNALRNQDDEKDVISFINSEIQTDNATYEGTERDVKRSFNLTHKNDKIFERYFEGNNSNIVSIASSAISIQNHFFVSGELIKYDNGGNGSDQSIGIGTTSFVGIGSTDKLPNEVFVVKLDQNTIQLARSAEDALKITPKTLNINSVGIGSVHRFVSTNQNSKVLVAIDNIIQSPVVSTAVTSTLAINAFTTDDILYFTEITSFFGGDLIQIEDEIMKIEGVGIGSTNAVQVRRPLIGTILAGYSSGTLITKVIGDYNIVDNVLNFISAPYGNIPLSSTTNPPDERDWEGVSTRSTFQGRTFTRSGVPNSSEEAYYNNYIFDSISDQFNGFTKNFTLTSEGNDISEIDDNNAVVLINGIFQEPGLTNDYNLTESVGITSITFTGAATSVSYDVNNASIPRGGIVASIGSTEGIGYQPLVSAGGTATVSIAGTIAAISIGNSGSGYREGVQIVNVGVSTSATGAPNIQFIGTATVSGGHVVSIAITNPGTGYTSTNTPYVIFDSPLSYSNIPLVYSSTSSGIGTQARINIVVGQGSSIIDFEITNTGYGYGEGQVLTLPVGGSIGIPTTGVSFREFQIEIEKTTLDKFTGWTIGELQVLDKIDSKFNGRRTRFPLTLSSIPISIFSSKGSNINIQDTLLVFINDILQVPGEGYIFTGGSTIRFTEALKIGDTCKILFYKGTKDVDVIDADILETVKVGDDLTIGYDPSIGQISTLQEDYRTVTSINSIDNVNTSPYFGPGNTEDENLQRPVKWCRQTEDRIIDEQEVSKDRILYEAIITPTSYLIQPVGVGSTILRVDNVRPFFNLTNESGNLQLRNKTQNSVIIISQDNKVGASATVVVSIAGTVTSIVISDGGVGYTITPTVSISQPIGFGTTAAQNTALASVTVSGGVVTGIAVTFGGGGYISTTPPQVLIESPSVIKETNTVTSYAGDSGVIVGFGTTATGIIFDLFIPMDSYLRTTSLTYPSGVYVGTAVTISGIGTGDYFLVYDSNIGFASTSITSKDTSNNTIGIGTNFINNVYQVKSVSNVSVANTAIGIATVGTATTMVRRVSATVSGISTISGYSGVGIGTTAIRFGNFSWGKIELTSRTKENTYNFYGNIGVGGISTSGVVKRTNPLRFSDYIT